MQISEIEEQKQSRSMDENKQRKADNKTAVARLVAKQSHGKAASQTSAESSKQEQCLFRDTPLAVDRKPLI